MSGARAWQEASKETEKGRVETAKVKRYRPGKVPEWMAPGADDGSVDAFVRAKGEETDGRTLKGTNMPLEDS
jgi:hypothetical protein